MEIESIGSMAALMLIFTISVILIKRNKAKRENRLLMPLQLFAKNNNAEITVYDVWNETIIGIDNAKQKLFFMRSTKDSQVQQVVYLGEIKKCDLFNSSKTTSTSGEREISIEKLELVFKYKNQSRTDTVMEFYNAKYDNLTINDELLLAEKWKKIVNSELDNLDQKKV